MEQREKERQGRMKGSAKAQFLQFKNQNFYDLELDTYAESIDNMIQAIQKHLNTPIRAEIQRILSSIVIFDREEKENIAFAQKWIATGAEIFRVSKPATPDPHLVAYFLLIDTNCKQSFISRSQKSRALAPYRGPCRIK